MSDDEQEQLKRLNALLARHEKKQRERARRVLGLLLSQPLVPDAETATDAELDQFATYSDRLAKWTGRLKAAIAKNLDHESMWLFVELATAKEVEDAAARSKQAEFERVRQKVAPAAERRRRIGRDSEAKLQQAVAEKYAGTRRTRNNVAALLAGDQFGAQGTIKKKLSKLFPGDSWPTKKA